MAAPVPCTARATISVTPSAASPHTSEAIVNTPTPDEERPLVPDGVADAPADQQQPAEGQHVSGDDPALAGVGQIEFGLQPRQRDDDDGAVERRHQLHAGDREDRDSENVRCQARRRAVG